MSFTRRARSAIVAFLTLSLVGLSGGGLATASAALRSAPAHRAIRNRVRSRVFANSATAFNTRWRSTCEVPELGCGSRER
jgi:hypothetical protein